LGLGIYLVGEVYYVVFLVYVGAAFPLVTLMLFFFSVEGAVLLFPLFASYPELVGESQFLKELPPFI
jgi:hypothetical protein